MTQPLEGSCQLNPDSQVLPGATLVGESGEFLFELDSYLQCVSEFELNPGAATASEPFGFDRSATKSPAPSDPTPTRIDQQQRPLDDDIMVTSNVAMLNTRSFGASDFFHQTSPMTYSQSHLHQPNHSTSVGAWTHNESGEPRYFQGNEAAQVSPLTQHQRQQQEDARYFTIPDVPKKKNQNRSRKRQRQELEQLRASVQGLQIQLETLLGGDAPYELSSVSRKQERQNFLDEVLAWKRTASIEKQQSEHAAIDNMRLRALVEENLVLCESFRKTCSKDGGGSSVPRELGSSFVEADADLGTTAVLPDSEVFDSLRDGLDAQYQRVNAVWDECNFANSNVETKLQNKLQSDADGSFFLEHRQSHIFPFSTDAVSRTTWSLTKGGFQSPRNGELKVWRFMGNTLYVTVADTVLLENAPDVTIRVWIALKRFIEDHRIAIVWRTKLEIVHSSSIYRLTETGWNTVRSLAGSESKGSLMLVPCISQSYIRVTPEQSSAISKDELSESSLTARVVNQYHRNMSLLNQEVENILLDEALGSRSVGSSSSRPGS